MVEQHVHFDPSICEDRFRGQYARQERLFDMCRAYRRIGTGCIEMSDFKQSFADAQASGKVSKAVLVGGRAHCRNSLGSGPWKLAKQLGLCGWFGARLEEACVQPRHINAARIHRSRRRDIRA